MKSQLHAFLLAFVMLIGGTSVFAQNTAQHNYSIDLRTVVEDRVKVTVMAEEAQPEVDEKGWSQFHFPMTIPGTYATLDYGKYIHDFEAFGKDGSKLKVKKKGNTYYIKGAPKRIEYWVEDTFDAKVKKNKVFEPAGTNIQEDLNYLLNSAGFFGFFDGKESLPVKLHVEKPENHLGVSAMHSDITELTQDFTARDYHQFLDCPIMFCAPDTTSFYLADTKVTMSVFSESGRPLSKLLYKEVVTSMNAIHEFLDGELPVDNYAFIFYLKDFSEHKDVIEGKSASPGAIIRLIKDLAGQGFGALEHGNSSVYFMPDFGNRSVIDEIKDVCIHEFFHILTPLSLHSECIGSFNYTDPVMSQHLWLYEGITEYFAGISQVKGDVISREKYFRELLIGKIKYSDKFPEKKMTFTEMSTNVLKRPWKKQYLQVYQRGAVMGALLDIEIMYLTGGKKDLKDVILELSKKYGATTSFSEDNFIEEFVAHVHPDLQQFFDRHVSGHEPLPIAESLAKVGITYHKHYKGRVPMDPLKDNDLKTKMSFGGGRTTIKSVGPKEKYGLRTNDMVADYSDQLTGMDGMPAEGDTIVLDVKRRTREIEIQFPVEYKEDGSLKYYIAYNPAATEEQLRLRELWLSN